MEAVADDKVRAMPLLFKLTCLMAFFLPNKLHQLVQGRRRHAHEAFPASVPD